MAKLIFDIETIGEDFESLDETSKEALTRWIKKDTDSKEEYEKELQSLKEGLGFSPFTGQIVAIGVLDYEKNKGVVTYQAPEEDIKEFEEENIRYKAMSEKTMLENFWSGAYNYNEFVTFNGRGFDVPFLMIRSAIHKIKPSKDLMSNRYIGSQKFGAIHIDLQDQLTFYGCLKRRGGLHIMSRAFGIKSPKDQGIKGEDVGRLFKEKKYTDIAKYNAGDLFATKELYTYWKNYLSF
ncbi:ribonuclease H-like domain-containing protein [Candidatus Giovannonibacteria bacterium]|nr:ribonuclease H-like domain-containing protein [Candidatus Giovannonibacteria bacterium]